MAFTVSHIGNTVMGNKNVRFVNVTLDSGENKFSSGFSVVEFISYCPVTCTTSGIHVRINEGTTSTATNGFVAITGAAANDKYHFLIIGR